MNIRVGLGYDVHRLAAEESLILGGVEIPHSKGTVGHSDADVLIHAICDALLGAANLGDIGYHFPDSDPQYKGVDSKILLEKVMAMIREKGYEPGNFDATIILEAPKIGPFITAMQHSLAAMIGTSLENISIKATTSEKIGFVGREEGIAAEVVTLIYTQS